MPIVPTLLWSVPYSPVLLRGFRLQPPVRKGASPIKGFFSAQKAPDGPCPELLPRQGVATCWARVTVTVL